ncbi:SMI1/KNR4 family protein [Chitinophaga japonensis]|uniref:SMI1/KNR4 family protein SUKH-1 n=1 Tax=Chitinophaga japonensis TaxID=104662 RepID=A0A562TED6_CHIJA|nr:SMI1/KNR4 family protein [Chitinophaga japonensis]TWI91638.1 SMI1/KNR4 family protein SUKH-1 [Chitinophaga japonensis]
MNFIDEIEKKIPVIKSNDPDLKKFGAREHKYQFNPTLTESEIDAFEEKFRIRLPEDYKLFITQIGNGGAGPYYGIRPLDIRKGPSDFKLAKNNPVDLAREFAFTEAWNADWIDTFDWDENRPPDNLVDPYLDTALISGTIPICHYGHGNMYLLVVKGQEFSHIWFDGRADFSGIFPESLETGNKERITFSDWYLDWLNKA